MLNQNNLSLLYKMISDDNQTFEKISESFQQNFKNDDKPKVGTTILFLLRDNLLNIHQRIISYYILYEISKKGNIELNPYIPIILEMLKSSQHKGELNFCIDYLNNQIDYKDVTVKNYIKDNSKELKINLNEIQKLYQRYDKYIINKNHNDKISPIIYDIKNADKKNIDNQSNLNLLNIENANKNIDKITNLNNYNPIFMSYYPANNNYYINSEPIWLFPLLKHNFIWEEKNRNNKK